MPFPRGTAHCTLSPPVSQSVSQSVMPSRGHGGQARTQPSPRPIGERRSCSGAAEASPRHPPGPQPGEGRPPPSCQPPSTSRPRLASHKGRAQPPPAAPGCENRPPPMPETGPGTPLVLSPLSWPRWVLLYPSLDSPPGGGRHRSPAGTRGCCSGTRFPSAAPGTPAREEVDGSERGAARLGGSRSPPRCSPHLPLPPQASAETIAASEGVEPGSKHGAQEMA